MAQEQANEVQTSEQRMAFARELDARDELRNFRSEFYFPVQENGDPIHYLVGNSLGLQPKRTAAYVTEELTKWKKLGVRGHFQGDHPWLPYHEFLAEPMANLVGARPGEVVMMNSLTANLHLMLATFYRPSGKRHKIVIEEQSFPSDYHAITSQIEWHGLSPEQSLITVGPEPGSHEFTLETIASLIEEQGDEIALILLPGVQYYTGQVFPMAAITLLAKDRGIVTGFDLAHAAGNIQLNLHEWDVDFAVWCSYKYLNSGPGSVGGCFVHERHATRTDLPRLAGWWGHDKTTRFQMKNEFQATPTAEGWQLSNPPILSLAAIRASLEVFADAGGMEPLVRKSSLMTQFCQTQLKQHLEGRVKIITPPGNAGCQLSLEICGSKVNGKEVHRQLEDAGIETDWREPNVIRAAPVPLYNSFEDCLHLVATLERCLGD